jgi:hypothetical protein
MGWFERRKPPGPRPFAGAELMESILAEGDWGSGPSDDDLGAAKEPRLGVYEWLALHAYAFVVGSLNLFFINLGHLSHGWWFWIPVVSWFGLLAAHGVWVVTFGQGRTQQRG